MNTIIPWPATCATRRPHDRTTIKMPGLISTAASSALHQSRYRVTRAAEGKVGTETRTVGLSTAGQFRLAQRCCAENPHMALGNTHTRGFGGRTDTRIRGHAHTRTGGRAHTRGSGGHAHTRGSGGHAHPGPPPCSPYNMVAGRR